MTVGTLLIHQQLNSKDLEEKPNSMLFSKKAFLEVNILSFLGKINTLWTMINAVKIRTTW